MAGDALAVPLALGEPRQALASSFGMQMFASALQAEVSRRKPVLPGPLGECMGTDVGTTPWRWRLMG
ncbi:MAG: hypothetical protein DRG36_05915 [Deltaproteobacteria bacterium]|nr:MAG: hypothetical protein DRG36_05915 [Deltaproteobacteria bacterium]